MLPFLFILLIHYNIGVSSSSQSSADIIEFSWKLPSGSSANNAQDDLVIKINVAGEIISTTYSTLRYIPNTKFSDFDLWPRDQNYNIFLDFPANLFKDFLSQLRRWSNRNNRSDEIRFAPPSWKDKDEFNEMLIALGFEKYQQIPPIQCIKHKVVNDFTRRIGSTFGDKCDTNETSGWTRFVDQAGTIVIDYLPEQNLRYCGGTSIPGWFLGAYPTQLYSTTTGTICYPSPRTGVRCDRFANQSMNVTHCGHYFVFDIPTAPECPLRVCTTDRPIPA